VAAAVLLAHVALLGGALRLTVWRDRHGPAPERQPLVVRLMLPPAAAPAAAPRQPAAPARALPARREPQAIALPAPVVEATQPPAPPAPAAVTAEVPASAPPPLDLRLPRGASAPWRAHNPALDDPRANSRQATLEENLAAAMGGDGRWVMERLDGDRIRYRRGNQCVEVQRTRAGQLELANGAFRNLWAAKGC
jgi:hypothetical protein